MEDKAVRAAVYSSCHSPSGQSLLSGGHWTRHRISLAYADVDPICPRCREQHEHVMHRLWHCRCNEPFQNRLAAAVAKPGQSTAACIDDLLSCFPLVTLRCGLFASSSGVTGPTAAAILSYLQEVNDHANKAHAADRAGQPIPSPSPGALAKVGRTNVMSLGLVPFKRKYWRTSADVDQCRIGATPTGGIENLTYSSDGSFSVHPSGQDIAGWGFVVALPMPVDSQIDLHSFRSRYFAAGPSG